MHRDLESQKHKFPEVLPEGIEGLHFHTLCEQNADDLVTTFQAFEEKFGKYLHCIKWLNLAAVIILQEQTISWMN